MRSSSGLFEPSISHVDATLLDASRNQAPGTLPGLAPAIVLYERCGFKRVPPYSTDVIPGVVYFG